MSCEWFWSVALSSSSQTSLDIYRARLPQCHSLSAPWSPWGCFLGLSARESRHQQPSNKRSFFNSITVKLKRPLCAMHWLLLKYSSWDGHCQNCALIAAMITGIQEKTISVFCKGPERLILIGRYWRVVAYVISKDPAMRANLPLRSTSLNCLFPPVLSSDSQSFSSLSIHGIGPDVPFGTWQSSAARPVQQSDITRRTPDGRRPMIEHSEHGHRSQATAQPLCHPGDQAYGL